jgi:hypothetical protein
MYGTAPELLYELAAAAQRMGTVPVAAVEMHRQTLLTAVRRCVQLHSSRCPLRMHPKKQESIRVFNPKFEEEGYVPGRDYDPDKVRAEQRKLKKIIKKCVGVPILGRASPLWGPSVCIVPCPCWTSTGILTVNALGKS